MEEMCLCGQCFCTMPKCTVDADCAAEGLCAEGEAAICQEDVCACIGSQTIEIVEVEETAEWGDEEIPLPLGVECRVQSLESENIRDYYDKTSSQLCSISDAFSAFIGTEPDTMRSREEYRFRSERSEFPGVLTEIEDSLGRAISETANSVGGEYLAENMVRFIETTNTMIHLCGLADYVCGHECYLCHTASQGQNECACKDEPCCNNLQSRELCELSETCGWLNDTANECAGKSDGAKCNNGTSRCCSIMKLGQTMSPIKTKVPTCILGAMDCGAFGGECTNETEGRKCGTAGRCCGERCIEGAMACDVGKCSLVCAGFDPDNCQMFNCTELPRDRCGMDNSTGICKWKSYDNALGDDDNDNDNVNRCYDKRTCDSDGDGIPDIRDADDDGDGIPDEEDLDDDGDGIDDEEDRLPGDDTDVASRKVHGVRYNLIKRVGKENRRGDEVECINACTNDCVMRSKCRGTDLNSCVFHGTGEEGSTGCGCQGPPYNNQTTPFVNETLPGDDEQDFDGDGVLRCAKEEPEAAETPAEIREEKSCGFTFGGSWNMLENPKYCVTPDRTITDDPNEATNCLWYEQKECRPKIDPGCTRTPSDGVSRQDLCKVFDCAAGERELEKGSDKYDWSYFKVCITKVISESGGSGTDTGSSTCDSDDDGTVDAEDDDDDNDGIPDEVDDDDDGDGNLDTEDLLPGDDDDFTFPHMVDDDSDCIMYCGPDPSKCDSDGDGYMMKDDKDDDEDGIMDTAGDLDVDGDGQMNGCVNICALNITKKTCESECPKSWEDGAEQCTTWSSSCMRTINRYYENLYIIENIGIIVANAIANTVSYSRENGTLVEITSRGGEVNVTGLSQMDLIDDTPILRIIMEELRNKGIDAKVAYYVADVVKSFIYQRKSLSGNATMVEELLDVYDAGIEANRESVLSNLENLAISNCDLSEALGCVEGRNAFYEGPSFYGIPELNDTGFWLDIKSSLSPHLDPGEQGVQPPAVMVEACNDEMCAFTREVPSLDDTCDVRIEGGELVLTTTSRGLYKDYILFVPNYGNATLQQELHVRAATSGLDSMMGEKTFVFPSNDSADYILSLKTATISFNGADILVRWGVSAPNRMDCTGPTPTACSTDYLPVCGSDGRTHPNACTACSTAGVEFYTRGECGSISPGTSPENTTLEIRIPKGELPAVWRVHDLGRLASVVKGLDRTVREERARQWARRTRIASSSGGRIELGEPYAYSAFMSGVFKEACLLSRMNVQMLDENPSMRPAKLIDVIAPLNKIEEVLPHREDDVLGRLFAQWGSNSSLPSLVTFGDPLFSVEDAARQEVASVATNEMLSHMCIQNIHRSLSTERIRPPEAFIDPGFHFDCESVKIEELCGAGDSVSYCTWKDGMCVNIVTNDVLRIIDLDTIDLTPAAFTMEESGISHKDLLEFDTATYVSPSCIPSILLRLKLGEGMCSSFESLVERMMELNCTKGGVVDCLAPEADTPRILIRDLVWTVECPIGGVFPTPKPTPEPPVCDSYSVELDEYAGMSVITGEKVEYYINVTDTSEAEDCKARPLLISATTDGPCGVATVPLPIQRDLARGESVLMELTVISFYEEGQCSLHVTVEDGETHTVDREYNITLDPSLISGNCLPDEHLENDVCCIVGETCCKGSEDCIDEGLCVGNYLMPAACGADHYCLTSLDVDKVEDCTKQGKLCSERHKRCMDPKELNIRIDLNVRTIIRDAYKKGAEVEIIAEVLDINLEPLSGATVNVRLGDSVLDIPEAGNLYRGMLSFDVIGEHEIVITATRGEERDEYRKVVEVYDLLDFDYEVSPLAVQGGTNVSVSVIPRDSSGTVPGNVLVKHFLGTNGVPGVENIEIPVGVSPPSLSLKTCVFKKHYRPGSVCITQGEYCCKLKGLAVLSGGLYLKTVDDGGLDKLFFTLGEDVTLIVTTDMEGEVVCEIGDDSRSCTTTDRTCSVMFPASTPGDLEIRCSTMGFTKILHLPVFKVITEVALSKTLDKVKPGEVISISNVWSADGAVERYDAYWTVDDIAVPSMELEVTEAPGTHEVVVRVIAPGYVEYSETFTMEVQPDRTFSAELLPDRQTVKPGVPATFTVRITNEGNIDQLFTLKVEGEDVIAERKDIEVPTGESGDVNVMTTKDDDGVYDVSVTVRSVEAQKRVVSRLEVVKEDRRGVNIELIQAETEVKVGSSVSLGFEVWNTGNVDDEYIVTSTGVPFEGVELSLKSNRKTEDSFPMFLSEPGTYPFSFSVQSKSDPSIKDEVEGNVVAITYEFALTPQELVLEGRADERKEFEFMLENKGQKTNTFSFASDAKDLVFENSFMTLEGGQTEAIRGRKTIKADVVDTIRIVDKVNNVGERATLRTALVPAFTLSLDQSTLKMVRGGKENVTLYLENHAYEVIEVELLFASPEGKNVTWRSKTGTVGARESVDVTNEISLDPEEELGEFSITVAARKGDEVQSSELVVYVVPDLGDLEGELRALEDELRSVEDSINELEMLGIDPASARSAFTVTKMSAIEVDEELRSGRYDTASSKLADARASLERTREELENARHLEEIEPVVDDVDGSSEDNGGGYIQLAVLFMLLTAGAVLVHRKKNIERRQTNQGQWPRR